MFFANPVAAAQLIVNQEQQNRFVGNVFGEYDLIQNLTFRTSLGADYLSSMQDFYSPSNTYPGVYDPMGRVLFAGVTFKL